MYCKIFSYDSYDICPIQYTNIHSNFKLNVYFLHSTTQSDVYFIKVNCVFTNFHVDSRENFGGIRDKRYAG